MSGRLRLSLQYKLFLAFVLVIVLPISLVSLVTTRGISQKFQQRNRERIRSLVRQMVKTYQQDGASAVTKISKAATAREITEIITQLNLSDVSGSKPLDALKPE